MNIVVVGSGAREHAICHKLRIDGHKVTAVPGNPGIAQLCSIYLGDPKDLVADLFVIGPEAPLVDGLADELRAQGKLVFGPGKDGAMLEGSKAFMKQVAADAKVPTAGFATFDDIDKAIVHLETLSPPYVIKTDGLAAGKGVLVTDDLDHAKKDVFEKLSGISFGDAGRRVIIEEGLIGREVSLLLIVDGHKALALSPATDHKRLKDDDLGPNTGGMGAYSPVPWFDAISLNRAMTEIVEPTIEKLISLGIDYRGILYAGLMVTSQGPKLIEYNVRFGDPEAQVVLPRILDDLGVLMFDAASGNLQNAPIRFDERAGVAVVMAAKGYPDNVVTGALIQGADYLDSSGEVLIFHAGTSRDENGELRVCGGRVLTVAGYAPSIYEARTKAYLGVEKIAFSNAQWRTDVAAHALS